MALILAGCGGRATETDPPGGGSSATSGDNGVSSSNAASIDVDAHGFPFLVPQPVAPPVQGDGRLPDLPETLVGGTPIGWDNCSGTPHLARGDEAGCRDCPTAQRGDDYLVAGLGDPSPSGPDPQTAASPQAYYYFGEPLHAPALWFDAFWINGASKGTTLTVWRASELCDPLGSGATYDAERLLITPGKWSTACVPLSSFGIIRGLAFRWDTKGSLGFDAIRFGDACPEP